MSTIGKLRRIALNQQGLIKDDSFGRGKQAALRAIEHLGYVQIDTISVVERAHHHVLWSRVSNYKSRFLDKLVKERKVFEYWFHAASWLPMSDYRFALPRMNKMNGERNWFETCDKKLIRHILERISKELTPRFEKLSEIEALIPSIAVSMPTRDVIPIATIKAVRIDLSKFA